MVKGLSEKGAEEGFSGPVSGAGAEGGGNADRAVPSSSMISTVVSICACVVEHRWREDEEQEREQKWAGRLRRDDIAPTGCAGGGVLHKDV